MNFFLAKSRHAVAKMVSCKNHEPLALQQVIRPKLDNREKDDTGCSILFTLRNIINLEQIPKIPEKD
jgi:hypothetical protein